MRTMLLSIQSSMSSCINASLKIGKTGHVISSNQSDVIQGWGSLQPKCHWTPGKITNQFRGWHFACQWYKLNYYLSLKPYLMNLILGARSSLELSKMELTKHRNPGETEDVIASGLSKEAWCFDGVKTMLKVFNCLVLKRTILTPCIKQEVG